LGCHVYVLRTTRDGTCAQVLVSDGVQEKAIADSFEAFVDKYLAAPREVAFGWT
jgi:hypothetical protein